jgi:hypothetical protein
MHDLEAEALGDAAKLNPADVRIAEEQSGGCGRTASRGDWNERSDYDSGSSRDAPSDRYPRSGEGGHDGYGIYREEVRPPTDQQKALASEEYLPYDVAPVLASLKDNQRGARILYVREELRTSDDYSDGNSSGAPARKPAHERSVAQIHRLADEKKVRVRPSRKRDLNSLFLDRPHQGVVLHATARL